MRMHQCRSGFRCSVSDVPTRIVPAVSSIFFSSSETINHSHCTEVAAALVRSRVSEEAKAYASAGTGRAGLQLVLRFS